MMGWRCAAALLPGVLGVLFVVSCACGGDEPAVRATEDVGQAFDEAGQGEGVGSGGQAVVKSLIFSGTLSGIGKGLSDQALAAQLKGAEPGSVHTVSLTRNMIGAEGVREILRSPATSQMRQLMLNSNPIGDEGLKALSRSPRLGALKRLQLIDVEAGAEGVSALARSEHIEGLELLMLSLNDIGDEGAASLAAMSGVASLHLEGVGLSGSGARALLEGASVHTLNVRRNALDAGSLGALSGLSPSLREVNLSHCDLSSADLQRLAAVEAPGLRSLVVDYNGWDDAAVRAFAAAPWLKQLELLQVGAHKASPDARRALRSAWGERPGLMVYARDL